MLGLSYEFFFSDLQLIKNETKKNEKDERKNETTPEQKRKKEPE